MQDDVITRSLAMFDCALWSPAKDEPPATTVSNTTPPTPLSTTTFSQSLSPSPPPPSYSLLPPIPPPLPSQPPPGYTVQDQELYLLLAAHWWNQPEAPLFCWRWISRSVLDFPIPERDRGKAFSANRHFSNIVPENREYWNSYEIVKRINSTTGSFYKFGSFSTVCRERDKDNKTFFVLVVRAQIVFSNLYYYFINFKYQTLILNAHIKTKYNHEWETSYQFLFSQV